ncbi:Fe(3+)-hydroxamate ABC transporter permease FhuB [Aquamicrobium sp. NLF2-7]|uniref:Fe(3+)-hydroxamate ABC transporter permease FhuB n=1 Tax=Aquamicrobium sp. NLF2-7 TaxID=2918753 RepID=UPI001EFC2C93|nr:Fe(3+)-hydroxamate ABC transporter permease FhuB [Aquamicrobium sp. NLF2-7]MCG8274457.1 Fe(3+)-hydroxamate ABC transporter permease FhuB [Aquamicrobium sp. NLF2-7]
MSAPTHSLRFRPALVACAGLALAAALAWLLVAPNFAAPATPGYDATRMVLFYSTLPRLATALIAGAALSLAGALFQLVLRNPLASPTTLGISAGANLALVITLLAFPALLGFGRDLVALAGSAAAAATVMGLGARRGFSPLSLVLSGLVISLWCGALAAVLTFLNDRYLVSLFIWGAGSLAQQSWDIPLSLLWKVAVLALLCAAIVRPLALLELGDGSAAALGVRLARLRFFAIAIAVALSALVTSAVGVIGFIGLVAPIIARLSGARRVGDILIWSSLIGAALLLCADVSVQLLAGAFSDFLPTGAVTAIFGTPVLLFLLRRLKMRHRVIAAPLGSFRRRLPAGRAAVLVLVAVVAAIAIAMLCGRDPDGTWQWLGGPAFADLLPLRLPRTMAALSSGAMLAVAGVLLQRLTGNEMASPEVLGISAGATFGLSISLFAVAASGIWVQLGFAAGGAFAVLAVILAFALRAQLAPERVLLAGIALSAMVDALVGVLASTGDPRALTLLRWMSGSTYGVSAGTAVALALAALLLIAPALLWRRWLDLLPLGPSSTAALGVPLKSARLALFCLAGLLSAVATLGVGPLSFVGLMAPHLAREAGLTRALPQMAGAALLGGALMVLADWLGRTVLFPYQIPAGLMSALVGAPFLMLLLFRKSRTTQVL